MKCECEDKYCMDFHTNGEKKRIEKSKDGQGYSIEKPVKECEEFRRRLREYLTKKK